VPTSPTWDLTCEQSLQNKMANFFLQLCAHDFFRGRPTTARMESVISPRGSSRRGHHGDPSNIRCEYTFGQTGFAMASVPLGHVHETNAFWATRCSQNTIGTVRMSFSGNSRRWSIRSDPIFDCRDSIQTENMIGPENSSIGLKKSHPHNS
jgi:hypothetical protein